ncbi:MAG: nucleoside deaminase [Candidatus Thermoplasmatota archaeon]|nr:nucleoside deaminase [Candidatus Thermoplasmatota archaeon]
MQELPRWLTILVQPGERLGSETEALGRTIQIATSSARHGGGPFGALVTTEDLEVVSVGWNHVIESRDSTAHAEVTALRGAQQALDTHDLSQASEGPLTMFSSCAPCIQCYGALYWSGLQRIISAAPASAAEAIGFQEGPVTQELWEIARTDKGLVHRQDAESDRDPLKPFQVYEAAGGEVY